MRLILSTLATKKRFFFRGLRNEWLRTVREGHNKLLTFTPRLPVGSVVCEKHFVNGGKIVNGIMEVRKGYRKKKKTIYSLYVTDPCSMRGVISKY